MNRELNIFWRRLPKHWARATAVLHAWQSTLVQQHPGLRGAWVAALWCEATRQLEAFVPVPVS